MIRSRRSGAQIDDVCALAWKLFSEGASLAAEDQEDVARKGISLRPHEKVRPPVAIDISGGRNRLAGASNSLAAGVSDPRAGILSVDDGDRRELSPSFDGD
jgi:hypothetical protein